MFHTFLFIEAIYSLEGHTYGYSTNKIPRYAEDLDRGVVATVNYAAKKYMAFISWRFLITDDDNIGFNVYREEPSTDPSMPNTIIKLNSEPMTKVTYYIDNTIDRTKDYYFFIGSVISSQEVENCSKYFLKGNTPCIPCYKVPLRKGCTIRTVWPGDLNGDGKFDFVVARNCDLNQKIEGYLSDGTFLWEIDLGPNSLNKNNIRPGPTTINVGHWDGVNVYDLNGDGKAEVFIRIANNVTFGDGYVFLNEGHEEGYPYLDTDQWIACIDGMTGKLRAKSPVPRDFIEHGAMGCQMGIGYFDGIKPSLVASLKNCDAKNNFHQIIATYSFHDSTTFDIDWYWTKEPGQSCEDGHHFRVADANLDGKDEFHNIGFILHGNGTLKCDMGDSNIYHGDRFYVGRFNKDEKQMMGYGVQQNNQDKITEYYYNADTCEVQWKHYTEEVMDNGRGDIGDFDPNTPGLEVFSFFGIYNAKTDTKIHDTSLWPANNLFWDGTLSTCIFHRMTINKWNAEAETEQRVYTPYSEYNKVFGEYPKDDESGDYPLFHGDIIGDWREEVIITTRDFDALIIFTTNMETEYRITSLSQDPGMRSSMSMNGYKQSHMSLMYMATDMDIDSERQYLKEYLRKRAEKSIIPSNEKTSSKCGSGCIAGITIAIIAVLALVIVGIIIFLRQRSVRESSSGALIAQMALPV